jgi:hypothetical protein
MTFTMRVLRAAGWFVAGFLTAVGQGLFGSKLHGLIADTRLYARWVRWITWQGASPDQRFRWLTVRELKHLDGEDRHDWVPTDNEMGRSK